MLILVYFVACGIGRLARFNVTAHSLTTDEGKVSHFEGTPIPTSLLVVGVMAIAFAQGAVHEDLWLGSFRLGGAFHPLVLVYALSGSLMVTAGLKIPKP
jgi:CDP-diacylglycerol--serine O-phosphatidyltransferase